MIGVPVFGARRAAIEARSKAGRRHEHAGCEQQTRRKHSAKAPAQGSARSSLAPAVLPGGFASRGGCQAGRRGPSPSSSQRQRHVGSDACHGFAWRRLRNVMPILSSEVMMPRRHDRGPAGIIPGSRKIVIIRRRIVDGSRPARARPHGHPMSGKERITKA